MAGRRRRSVMPLAPPTWAKAELGAAALGDARRTRGAVTLAADLAAQPAAALPRACPTSAALSGGYRFG